MNGYRNDDAKTPKWSEISTSRSSIPEKKQLCWKIIMFLDLLTKIKFKFKVSFYIKFIQIEK